MRITTNQKRLVGITTVAAIILGATAYGLASRTTDAATGGGSEAALMEHEMAVGQGAYERSLGDIGPDCATIAGAWIEDAAGDAMLLTATQTKAANVTVSAFDAGGSALTDLKDSAAALPAHCVVTGLIAPQVQFELRLPDAAAWNGRFMLVTCAGFCGSVSSSACNPALSRGYAVVTTNGGHDGSPGFEAVWANGDNPARHDFAYRANHVATLLAKALIKSYYGRAAEFSYVAGCSKGGNSAVRNASRYPNEFDGILASAPVLDYQGRLTTSFSWQAQALSQRNGEALFSPEDFARLHTNILSQCDMIDGRADGVLNDPAACEPDFPSMDCSRDKVAEEQCFSKDQIAALERIYALPSDSNGRAIYPAGQTPGSELSATPWLAEIPGVPGTPLVEQGANQWLRYMAFSQQDDGAGRTADTFDFDKDPAKLPEMAEVYNATDTDLSAFDRAGGKLLIMHGTADEGISLATTVDFYKKLIAHSGGLSQTQRFARLFQVPGMAHCSGGAGYDQFDALTALENWVEKGHAPERIVAQRTVAGSDKKEGMPLYPYPLVPQYTGSGDETNPANYRAITSASWSASDAD